MEGAGGSPASGQARPIQRISSPPGFRGSSRRPAPWRPSSPASPPSSAPRRSRAVGSGSGRPGGPLPSPLLACPQKRGPPVQEDWDPRPILARIEPRLALETDEQLVAWTPAIAALAAQPNDRLAVSEVTEAAERIAGLESVPWPVRREALESLLASLPDLFLDSLAGFRPSRASRRAKTALSTLGHLPLRLAPGKGRDELVAHWDEIQPLVTAATERISRPRQRKEESGDRPEDLRNLIDQTGKPPSEPGVEALVRRL